MQRKVKRLECDRCIKATAAAVTIPFTFNGNAYETDLCDPHADAFQRDMSAWTRVARDLQAESRERIFGDKKYSTIGKGRSDLPENKSSTVTLALAPEPEVAPYDPEFDYAPLWPTHSSSEDMARHDIKWPDVVAAVNGAAAITPSDKPDVYRYLTLGLSILVAEDGHVLGVAPRDPAEPLPKTVAPRAAIRRRGKRGGIGNVGPRTFDDILTAIRATPGWEVTSGGKHWRVRGPEGQTSTLPKTSSDWRAAANAVSELRKIGLDLRQPAKVS